MSATMTRAELEQVKADVERGVMISRETWRRVLESAIGSQAMAFTMQQDALYPGYQVPVKEPQPMASFRSHEQYLQMSEFRVSAWAHGEKS